MPLFDQNQPTRIVDRPELQQRLVLQYVLFGVAAMLLTVGVLMLSPLKAEVCESAIKSDENNCAMYNVVLVLWWKIFDPTTATALATVAVAAFTGTLWWSTRGLLRATNETINLARAEFVSSHRPRVILREAFIGAVLENEPIKVIFRLANVGDTTGRIIRSLVRVDVVTYEVPLWLLDTNVEQYDDIGETILLPGQDKLINFKGETPRWDGKRFQRNKDYEKAYVDIVGQILYTDVGPGICRRTAFRRRLVPARQRFYRIPDEPDLDYSD